MKVFNFMYLLLILLFLPIMIKVRGTEIMTYGNQALLEILYFICTLFCGLKQGELLETGREKEDVS